MNITYENPSVVDTTFWMPFTDTITSANINTSYGNYKGEYDSNTYYDPNDLVRDGSLGSFYYSIKSNPGGTVLSNTANWIQVNYSFATG